MVDWVVSEAAVKRHPQYGELDLDDILAELGMDISQGYVTDGKKAEGDEGDGPLGVEHRCYFTGQVHTCPRHHGTARKDGDWPLQIRMLLLETN